MPGARLGGMIGNNSCGTHGLYAGKTSDNVDRLSVVLAGGEALEVGAYDAEAVSTATAAGGRLGHLLAGLQDLERRYAALVKERFPVIPRRVSGYNLDELAPERGFHVARALVGTESTCALTTEATLRLVASPPERCLVALGYPDVFAAAEAVPELLSHPLLALEGFDRTLVDQMEAHRLNADGVALLPPGNGWLLAELGGETGDEALSLAEALVSSLPAGVSARQVRDAATQRQLWAVRESGLGATAIRLDGHHNYEGWEDGAVPPARLAEYLRGITGLWAQHGYSGAWYGHFGQGCVHTRNNFDLGSREGLRQYRSYVTAAAELVVSLGGSLSGEHGDGQSRGELLEVMFGRDLVEGFGEFKALWDPDGLMNPGKVVHPYPLDSNIRYSSLREPVNLRPTGYAFDKDAGSLMHAALRCVGVGRCRRDDAATMCPSYRATRDEVHSTRGRAKILTEMFQTGTAPGETLTAASVPPSWHNEQVREALDLCLSCKACASDCPTHVDMATYKSEFLSHYYKGRRRPPAMYAMGLLPLAARVANSSPSAARLVNASLASPLVGRPLKRLAGLTERRPAPRFADAGRGPAGGEFPGVLDREPSSTSVVVWPDTFTNAFNPGAARDSIEMFAALGETVAVPSAWACCGRTLYDFGMLDLAKRWLLRLITVLAPWAARDIPVVVPEPSCLAAFRDELPALLPGNPRAARLASLARSPAEHLVKAGHLAQLEASADGEAGHAVLHPHCHQRSVVGTGAEQEVLRAAGFTVDVLDAGCCGLAGSFGFDAHHEAVSRKIGADLWLPKVRVALSAERGKAGSAPRESHSYLPRESRNYLVVDGFSCRAQLEHLGPDLLERTTTLAALVRSRAIADPR